MSGSETAHVREQYRLALQQYLAAAGEAPLAEAYRLGRQTLVAGHGLLELIDIHQEAVLALTSGPGNAATPQQLAAIGRFLMESLSSYDMMQRGHQEANAALRRLNEILEAEAKRIAYSLHDEAAQMLAAAYLELGQLKRDIPESLHERVVTINTHLDRVREDIRRLSHELHPPILDQLGLVPALQFLVGGVRQRTSLEMTVESDFHGRCSQTLETAVYRTVQEALNNVTRHAQAREVRVRIWDRDRILHCTISDDGIGFDPHAVRSGLGLIGIQERVGILNGSLQVESAPGRGTRLHVAIPVQ